MTRDDDATARQLFHALAEGGQVAMPYGQTFFAKGRHVHRPFRHKLDGRSRYDLMMRGIDVSGKPCWFELSTNPASWPRSGVLCLGLAGALPDSGMTGMTYHLAEHGRDMVAGAMEMPANVVGMPPFWMIYLDVDDADATAAKIKALGGHVFANPPTFPGTGRFAIASDPQGAAFGLLAPLPMDPQPRSRPGHGASARPATATGSS